LANFGDINEEGIKDYTGSKTPQFLRMTQSVILRVIPIDVLRA